MFTLKSALVIVLYTSYCRTSFNWLEKEENRVFKESPELSNDFSQFTLCA